MSQKTRIDKLLDRTLRTKAGPLESRKFFDMRVQRVKDGYGKFGYDLTDEQATLGAYRWAKTKPHFTGFAFDLTDVGLDGAV